jgi:hypothetical protein
MVAEDDVLSTSSQPAAEHTSPPASETVSMPATTTTTHAWDAMQCWQLSQRDVAHSRPASSTFNVLSPAPMASSEARVSPSHPTYLNNDDRHDDNDQCCSCQARPPRRDSGGSGRRSCGFRRILPAPPPTSSPERPTPRARRLCWRDGVRYAIQRAARALACSASIDAVHADACSAGRPECRTPPVLNPDSSSWPLWF